MGFKEDIALIKLAYEDLILFRTIDIYGQPWMKLLDTVFFTKHEKILNSAGIEVRRAYKKLGGEAILCERCGKIFSAAGSDEKIANLNRCEKHHHLSEVVYERPRSVQEALWRIG